MEYLVFTTICALCRRRPAAARHTRPTYGRRPLTAGRRLHLGAGRPRQREVWAGWPLPRDGWAGWPLPREGDLPAAAQASKVNADRAFWREGEERFTRLLHEAIGQLGKGDWTKAETRLLTDWRNTLIGQINGLFDRFVFSASPEEANPARVFKAQKALRKNLWGAKLRNELNLPEPEKPKRRANS